MIILIAFILGLLIGANFDRLKKLVGILNSWMDRAVDDIDKNVNKRD